MLVAEVEGQIVIVPVASFIGDFAWSKVRLIGAEWVGRAAFIIGFMFGGRTIGAGSTFREMLFRVRVFWALSKPSCRLFLAVE
jgi:hypothetical protein